VLNLQFSFEGLEVDLAEITSNPNSLGLALVQFFDGTVNMDTFSEVIIW